MRDQDRELGTRAYSARQARIWRERARKLLLQKAPQEHDLLLAAQQLDLYERTPSSRALRARLIAKTKKTSRDPILTDSRGRPIERPRRADYRTDLEFLHAFHAYKDKITRESQAGGEQWLRKRSKKTSRDVSPRKEALQIQFHKAHAAHRKLVKSRKATDTQRARAYARMRRLELALEKAHAKKKMRRRS